MAVIDLRIVDEALARTGDTPKRMFLVEVLKDRRPVRQAGGLPYICSRVYRQGGLAEAKRKVFADVLRLWPSLMGDAPVPNQVTEALA